MIAPRRLQLRRGNTAATSTYVGAAGELVVDTTTNTLYLHDGSTVGGYATTTNTAAINNQISSVNANITLANTGMQGYVNLANTIQSSQIANANVGMRGYVDATIAANIANIAVASTYSNINVKAYTESMGYQNYGNVNVAAYVTTANSAIIGYIDLANTIQSAQVGAANLAITAANLGMKGYVDSVASQSIYGNGNVKSYLTQFDGNIIPSANTVFSLGSVTNQWRDLFVSNNTIYVGGVPIGIDTTGNLTINGTVIPTISYVNTVVANVVVDLSSYALNANVTAANVGLKGYVDQANTIQGAQLTSANLGVIGYVDLANTIQSGQVGAANLAITAANVGLKGYIDSQSFYSNVKVATYLPTYSGNIAANISKAGYTWTFGTGGTTQFPNSLILAPVSQSITMQSDQYSQLMWENANLTVAPNMAINSNFYVAQNNATLDIGYRDGSGTQLIKSWYWSVDGNLTLPSGGYILNSDNSIYGGGNYSNVQVETYLPTYSGNVANIRLGTSGILTFADGTTQITAGGGSYSNVQVATYLPTYAGTVSASLVNSSGNILSSGLSVFGNTRIGLAGAVSGQFHSVVGNITQTSSGGAVYINTTGNVLAAAVVAGAVTSTGTVAVNAATGITTNQATFLLANATATTINMGGAATTIRMGTITSNVFVGSAIGNSNKELTLRAQGTWNIATSIDSSGGFNSPPYSNQLVIGGSGTGMTANYSATGGYLTTVTIYNRGTGYQNGDVLSVPGGVAGNSFTLTNYSSTLTGNSAAAYTFGIEGNLTVPGNVTARNFIGGGALLTTLPGYAYSNVNVAALITTNGLTNYSNVNVIAYLAGNITVGNITGSVNSFAIGYRDVPQITVANLTLIASDAGKHYYGANTNPTTITIPLNSSVAFGNGTAISIVNQGTGNITVANAAGVSLYLAGNSTAGSRTLTSYGMATLIKVQVNTWFINGTGVV